MNVGKLIGAFALGAVAGAAASYFVMKDKLREQADEEIENVKNYYHDKYGKKIDEVKKNGEVIRKEQKKLEDLISTTNYKTFSDDKDINKEAVLASFPKEEDDIYEIDYTEYVNGEELYEKKELKYYIGDQTLVDENDEPVEIDHSIGYDITAQIEDGIFETVYVRNDTRESDFEVSRLEGCYKDLLGDI